MRFILSVVLEKIVRFAATVDVVLKIIIAEHVNN